MNGRRRSKRLLRLIEFSPLLAAAVLAFIWISIPMQLTADLLTRAASYEMLQDQPPSSYHMPEQNETAEQYFADRPGVMRGGMQSELRVAAQKSFDRTMPSRGDLFDSSGAPNANPWDDDSSYFEPIREFEAKTGATVYAFFTPMPEAPSTIASALAAPALLPSAAELASTTLDADGKNPYDEIPAAYRAQLPVPAMRGPRRYRDAVEWAWWMNRRQAGEHPGFQPDFQGSSSSSGGQRRNVHESYRAFGKRVYYFMWIVAPEDEPDNGMTPLNPAEDLLSLDPAASGFQPKLEAEAKKLKADVFVAGPLDVRLVPLYRSGKASHDLAAAWSWRDTIDGALRHAPTEVAAATGAAWMLPVAIGYPERGLEETTAPAAGRVEPQGTLYVATWKESPSLARPSAAKKPPLARAWLRWQLLAAGNALGFLVFGIALFAGTLVASPAAFIFERKREAQERVLAEFARVQQDAHDKVYNRLSALSKRVAIVSEQLSESVAETLETVAEDIRHTVGDLQDILGDANREASALAGAASLQSQLEHICTRQGTSLGMRVECSVAHPLPELPPDLGWDLQCVIEEALTNAAKHGGATRCDVRVSANGVLRAEVSDNGTGTPGDLEIDALPESSRGLRGMRDRARRRGGDVRIERTAEGTRLVFEVPLPKRPNGIRKEA